MAEVVDPICLGVKIIEKGNPCNCCCSVDSIPEHVHNSVRGQIVEDGSKDLVVTLGIFALIRLERTTQIVVQCGDGYSIIWINKLFGRKFTKAAIIYLKYRV